MQPNLRQRQANSLRKPMLMLGMNLAGTMLVLVLPAQIRQAQARPAKTGNSSAPHGTTAGLSPYIDVHTHLDEFDVDGSMQSAIRAMPEENLAKIVFMPSPFTLADANRFDVERLLPAAKKYPGKIAVLGGGGTLNPMIIDAAHTGDAGSDAQKKFKERAEAIVAAGGGGVLGMYGGTFTLPTPYLYAHTPTPPTFFLVAFIAQ